MGGRQSKQASLFDEQQWTVISQQHHQLFTNVNTYATRALRNTRTAEEIEEYQLEFASQSDYLQYGKQLRLRKEPSSQEIEGENNHDAYYQLSPYIYTVKYFVNDTVEDMCSTVYKARLYTRKVDLRLKEINDIPFADQLYLTKAALTGFKVLYEKMGYFDICEEMIFITRDGEVKVWIHPNLSKNQPYYYPNSNREPQGSQADMIVKLLDIIEENTDQYAHEAFHFRDYLVAKNIYERLSFYRALEEFELYCVEEHLAVDDYMQSIYELYHPDEEQLPPDSNNVYPADTPRRYHELEAYPQEATLEQSRNYTPIKSKELQMENHSKQIGPRARSPLYNSQTGNQNPPNRDTITRPQYQSLQKSLYAPPRNIPNSVQNTPQFNFPGPILSLHMRGASASNANELARQAPMKESSHQIGSPAPLYNKDTFRAASQKTSQRANTFMSIDRGIEPRKTSNIVKFNYGSSNGAIPQPVPVRVPDKQPQTIMQNYRPPMMHKEAVPPRQAYQPNFPTQQPFLNQQLSKPPMFQQAPYPVSRPSSNSQTSPNKPPTRLAAHLNTVKTIKTQSVPSVLEGDGKSNAGSKVTYYSANEVYNLDSEIASDLEAFLGYNARA